MNKFINNAPSPGRVRGGVAHLTIILIALLAMMTGKAFAVSSWTVSNDGNKFTIARSGDTDRDETVRYRTVSITAYPGYQYTNIDGVLTFAAGEVEKEVTVDETTTDVRAYRYQVGDTRKYRFEVTDWAGAILAYKDRVFDTGISLPADMYDEKHILVNEGPITVTDKGYQQGYHAVDMVSYYSEMPSVDYMGEEETGIRMRVTFDAAEINDGYQYMGIYTGIPEWLDEGAGNGVPYKGDMWSDFVVSFAHKDGTKCTDVASYEFPVAAYQYTSIKREGVWNYLGNEVGVLCYQEFKTSGHHAEDGRLNVNLGENRVVIRFDASGSKEDNWTVTNLVAHIQAVNKIAPTYDETTGANISGGLHAPGNTFYISIPFQKALKVKGTPTLKTSWGEISYIEGSGSNVLTFMGTIDAAVGTRLHVIEVNGKITDMSGNSFKNTRLGLSYDLFVEDVPLPETGSAHFAATEPTCFKNGNIEYWRSTDGTYYTDEALTNEVSADDIIVHSIGHALGSDGSCAVCGDIPLITDIINVSGNDVEVVNPEEGWGNVFDGNPATKLCVRTNSSNTNVEVYFDTSEPVIIKRGSIITGNDIKNNPRRNPKSITLEGQSFSWMPFEKIAYFNDDLPEKDMTEVEFDCEYGAKVFSHFRIRFEFKESDHSVYNDMEIGEVKLWGLYQHHGVAEEKGNGFMIARFSGSGERAVSIPKAWTVGQVIFDRRFVVGQPAALYMPFDITEDMDNLGAQIYKFDNTENVHGEWIVTVRRVHALERNIPAIIIPERETLDFTSSAGDIVLRTEDKEFPSKEGWTLKGTYQKITWDDESSDYGYSEANADDDEMGIMTNMGAGDFILPLHSYISYAGESSPAVEVKARHYNENIPQYIIINFVDEDGNPTKLNAPVIKGTPIQDGWYTLDGKRLPNAPRARGIYIYNGKKVIKP